MDTNSNKSIEDIYNQVLLSVRSSNLNFSSQETPYSIYLTIRKSLIKLKGSFVNAAVSSHSKDRHLEELED